jgi:hypothetical protein
MAKLMTFFRNHKNPLLALVLLPIFANIIALSGFFNTDPTLQYEGLGQHLKAGWISGPMGWLDPSVAYITQPIGHLAATDWLHGIVPWWNSFSGIGMPLAGEMQTSAFFLPFVLLLHFNCGWLLLRVTLQILCGLFGYALLIEIGLTRTAAFLGGVLYALSPLFFLCPSAPIAPLPFLPLLLLGIERSASAAAQKKSMGWSLIAVACAYSIYAGNPEVAYFNGLLAGFWGLWRLFVLPPGAWLRFVGKLCIGIFIGICVSLPLLLPFFDYLRLAYVGPHDGLFRLLHLENTLVPLQILPFLYGQLGSIPPPALAGSFDWVRLPAWVGLPVLTLALAAIWRRGKLPALRLVLLFWLVLWEARYKGFPPVVWLMNLVPGIGTADSTRYSGAAFDFAIFVLASLGFDDYQRLSEISRIRVGVIIVTLAAIIIAVIAPVSGFIRAWYGFKPQDMFIAIGTTAFAAVILFILFRELRRPLHRHRLIMLLIAGPLITFMVPQLAGFRSGQTDFAPIEFLKTHAGTSRMVSLGPFDLNFPARYEIASVNYSALPAPVLWTDYIASKLFPQTDLNTYGGGAPGQPAALIANLQNYEAVGVRYVVTRANDDPWGKAFNVVDATHRNAARPLMPGGSDISGTISGKITFPMIDAVSVVVGTYMGASRGPVTVELCAAGACAEATADAVDAPDDAPFIFKFQNPLNVPAGAPITYRFSHPLYP